MSRSDPLQTILLVEDDADIREVAELALTHAGDLEVVTCARGTEAREAVERVEPDLVLLDVMMPEVDGVEVFRQLQNDPETASIPVVFLTARAQPDEVDEYRQLGVLDVIVKPFDPTELPERVRQAWDRA